MPKPICAKCLRFYRPKKNGIFWLEQMPLGNDCPPGKSFPDLWTPYKIWAADLWECQDCGHELITGHGGGPISEHYEPEFKEWLSKSNAAKYTVNDC